MRIFILTILISVFGLGGVALAQEALEEKDQEARNEILTDARNFAKDLDKAESRHFAVMYGNYNMVSVVKTVQDQLDEAVDACGDKNPDMEDALDARFKEWEEAVEPVIEQAEANVSNMVLAQEYAKARDLKNFFNKIDRVRKERNNAVNKVPVTSKEGCENMLKAMDQTQENMVRLLQQTLVTLPHQIQLETEESAEEKKAEAEEEAAKKEAEEE